MLQEFGDSKEKFTDTESFTPGEVCELFRIKRSTLRLWTMRNIIPHVKVTRKTLLFPKKTILNFLKQKLVGVEETPKPLKSKRTIKMIKANMLPGSSSTDATDKEEPINQEKIRKKKNKRMGPTIYDSIFAKIQRDAGVFDK